MRKKRQILIFHSAIFQIALLIGMSFAFSFVMSGYVGVGSAGPISSFSGSTSTSLATESGLLGKPSSDLYKYAGSAPPANTISKTSTPTQLPKDQTQEYWLKTIDEANTIRPSDVGPSSDVGPDYFADGGGGDIVPPETGGGLPPPSGEKADVSIGGLYGGKIFGATGQVSGTLSALTGGLVWGATVYGIVLFGAKLFGVNDKQAKSIALSAGSGFFVAQSLRFMGQNQVLGLTAKSGLVTYAPLIGIGVGVAIFLLTYKKEKKEIIRFECFAWEAPIGGRNCAVCNENPLMPCSEYRCKSLGQACELVNPGSEEEKCVWIHPDDTSSPKIEVWDEALKPSELEYVPLDAARPGMRGVKIVKRGIAGGCLQAFTKLEFGVLTDEPAQCRLDLDFNAEFDDMDFFFGETNLLLEEHAQLMRVPDPFNEQDGEAPVIHNDGTYTLYARCQDANGNSNEDVFAIEYCVQPGPDTTAPFIEGTSIDTNSPVRFDADLVPIEIYVNEPATCKWSWDDKAFSAMENDMTCATETYQINANLDYVCSANLNGIQNRENNDFFFRCVDRFDNEMLSSNSLVLRGTEPLVIESVGPVGTFTGSGQNVVEVVLTAKTAHGANEGSSTCHIASDSSFSDIVAMESTGTFEHSQILQLLGGNYTFFFRCIDAGGNRAEDSTNFNVEIDNVVPLISRVFRDGTNLKVITSEAAKCAYSLTGCNFNLEESGSTAFSYENALERKVHVIPWDVENTYHIKCEDLQGNQPFPDQCQLTVQGSDF